MVSPHVFSQLILSALLWLVVIVHLTRPKRPVTAPATPTEEPEPLKPKRHRSNAPKPFEGLTKRPPCAHAIPRIPNRLLRCRPIRWHRRTVVPVRSTPLCTFVRTAIVTIRGGSGWAMCAPTVIPVVGPLAAVPLYLLSRVLSGDPWHDLPRQTGGS
jgi:hypothetical protein